VSQKSPDLVATTASATGPLRQAQIWDLFSTSFRDGDSVIAEVGSAQYATLNCPLPTNAEYYTQLFYSSIGFTVGATLGTLLARQAISKPGRTILFVGDGSLQLTVQEISTMIHNGLAPTIVVINNAGYTVERVIHGPERKYNDIDPWNYQSLLHFFGASQSNSRSYRAETFEELRTILNDKEFQENKTIQLLEVVLDKYDSPAVLSELVDRSQKMQKAALEVDDEKSGRRRKVLDTWLQDSGLGREFRAWET
jgi:pyruvate decarboxylase